MRTHVEGRGEVHKDGIWNLAVAYDLFHAAYSVGDA